LPFLCDLCCFKSRVVAFWSSTSVPILLVKYYLSCFELSPLRLPGSQNLIDVYEGIFDSGFDETTMLSMSSLAKVVSGVGSGF